MTSRGKPSSEMLGGWNRTKNAREEERDVEKHLVVKQVLVACRVSICCTFVVKDCDMGVECFAFQIGPPFLPRCVLLPSPKTRLEPPSQCLPRPSHAWRRQRAFRASTSETPALDASHADAGDTKWSNLAVARETKFADGRYGICSGCGEPVVIPGLSHQLCQRCGWVERPAHELQAAADDAVPRTGHHN
jgi:hypothetical protein